MSMEKFSDIYRLHAWGGASRSGPGSDPANIRIYLDYIQHFINGHDTQVKSIVDLGCGDWAYMEKLDLGRAEYLGLDVVPQLIAENSRRFGSDKVRFDLFDIDADYLPPADLLICKDVLQHLGSVSVQKVLSQMHNFRYCLLTNDIDRFHMPYWPLKVRHSVARANIEISDGGWRPLKLGEEPFSIRADQVLQFDYRLKLRTIDRKETLLWRNPRE